MPLRSLRRDEPRHDLLGQLRRHHGADPVDVPVRVQLDQVGADKPARKFLNDRQHLACRQPARLVVRDTGCKGRIKRSEIQRQIDRPVEPQLADVEAMAPAFSPKVIRTDWMPQYMRVAEEYVARLPRGEIVDLFPALSGPYAARGLGILLGIEEASDNDLQRWSQTLIDGAGNFGWRDEPFAKSDAANEEMNTLIDSLHERHLAEPNNSALSVMLNADDPIETTQIYSNIKIAIGGGINEPRDALNTILFGLLTNPDQLRQVKQQDDWERAFEEGIRWVAPIQVSSRLVMEDTEIRGFHIPKGDTVMTIQASANRDEDRYEDGESFQVYRERQSHQAFGNGPHFCQGTHVARRAVAHVMLPMLFDRFPDMTIPDLDDVIWRGFGFRGPTQIPVKLQ